ncbi:bifunctional RNase H/acid phosphatase [Luedemannella flava]|uniref:Bifunctional RNase H/acid phosphatase n=1 Tax=Luedemannella flava TaxID=349316 RepID=A0ABP4YBZ2_9ACTN
MARRLKVIVEADGGARGNPGPAGYGAVVREAATGEVLVERAAAIGHATNNVAEYSGLIAGLKAAADLGAVDVEVRMDSKLVVEQMAGRWKISNPTLRVLAAQAAVLVKQFDTVRFAWIPRAQNAAADALANAAMDGRIPDDARELGELIGSTGPQVSWAPPADVGAATRLILVRHGETALTAQRRYSGRGDVPLSAIGRDQARAAAARVAELANGTVDTLITSPLGRCRQTAEIISAAVGMSPIAIDQDLIECDFGEWEGLTFGEVRDRWPDEMSAWLSDPAIAPPGGESFRDVTTRVRRSASALFASYPGRTVVLVSHVTPIKLILRDALSASDAFLHRLFLDAAGISLVDRWPDGGIAVRTVNDTAHLAALGSADRAEVEPEPEGGDATDE